MRFPPAAILALTVVPAWAQTDSEVYTLYRNSLLDPTMRLQIATFDASDGKDYNAENCNVAANLFQAQDGVQTRFWCEQGRYRK
jgi:hypothetical protein